MLVPPMLCNDGDGDDAKGENGVVIGDENDKMAPPLSLNISP